METQVKEKGNEVNLEKIEKYFETVSKHLFMSDLDNVVDVKGIAMGNKVLNCTDKGKFFKAFSVKIKDKLYYVTMRFDGINPGSIYIGDINWYVNVYKNCAKNVISDIIFPKHYNQRTSIPNFKAMKEKVAEIKKFIEENFNGENNREIEKEIDKMLIGLTVKKEEA